MTPAIPKRSSFNFAESNHRSDDDLTAR